MTKSTDKTKPLFWEKNFIENFRNINASLNIGMIIWNKDANIIKDQIRKAMQGKADVLLSEILPDDLQDNLLDEEYNYFCERYIYVPPNIEESDHGKGNDDSILVILNNTDERNQDSFWRTCLPVIEKLQNTKFVYADNDPIVHKDVTKFLRDFAKIYIDCDNPQISLFYVLNSLSSNIPIFIENPQIISTKLWALGVIGFESMESHSKNTSLRSRFRNIYDLEHITPLNPSIFRTLNLDFSEINNFEKFSKNSRIKEFLYRTRNNTRNLEDVRCFLMPRTQINNLELSRFKINFFNNLLQYKDIEQNVQKVVFQKLFLHLIQQQHSLHTFEKLYYLFKKNLMCTAYLIDTLNLNRTIMSENRGKTEENFFSTAKVLYFLSLNTKNTEELSEQYLTLCISILKFYSQSNPKEVTYVKDFLNFLLLDNSQQILFAKDKINSFLDQGSGDMEKGILPIILNKYFDSIQNETATSVDERLHNYIVLALSYKAGVCPTAILFEPKENLKQFDSIKEELIKCFELGFQSFHLLIMMRDQLTWNQIDERSSEFKKVHKYSLRLHCLDSLNQVALYKDITKNNLSEMTKTELSFHFSILVILSKSLNKPLNKEFKNQITSHINSLSSEKDFYAYSFAYFLAKAVNHQSLEEILLKSESGNILFHRVNTFLENQ